MNILFICKHNRFRSKVSEAIFNFHNKNKSDNAISRGIKNGRHEQVAPLVVEVMNEKGYFIMDIDSQLIEKRDIDSADKIIIVADNVPAEDFPINKTEVWPIEDCSEFDKEAIKQRVDLIEQRVKELISQFS